MVFDINLSSKHDFERVTRNIVAGKKLAIVSENMCLEDYSFCGSLEELLKLLLPLISIDKNMPVLFYGAHASTQVPKTITRAITYFESNDCCIKSIDEQSFINCLTDSIIVIKLSSCSEHSNLIFTINGRRNMCAFPVVNWS